MLRAMHGERRLDRAKRLTRRALTSTGEELREARLSAGLAQRDVATRLGVSHSHVSRVERGLVSGVPMSTLIAFGAVLGIDVVIRAYPNGDPVRDAAHLELLARFRQLLPSDLRHRTEVPLGIPGDQRAWDEVVEGRGWRIPIEAETRLRDTQALRRRLALKLRDSGMDRMLLVVADTRHNRHVLRFAVDDFADAFPVRGRDAVAALRHGACPPGSAIVLV